MTGNQEIESLWTVVANVVTERPFGPQGIETKLGTNLFAPKTKVYIIDWFAGMCESVTVVGLSRHPKKFIKTIVRVDMIENFRVKLCYEPKAIELIKEHFNSEHDKIDRLNTIAAWSAPNFLLNQKGVLYLKLTVINHRSSYNLRNVMQQSNTAYK